MRPPSRTTSTDPHKRHVVHHVENVTNLGVQLLRIVEVGLRVIQQTAQPWSLTASSAFPSMSSDRSLRSIMTTLESNCQFSRRVARFWFQNLCISQPVMFLPTLESNFQLCRARDQRFKHSSGTLNQPLALFQSQTGSAGVQLHAGNPFERSTQETWNQPAADLRHVLEVLRLEAYNTKSVGTSRSPNSPTGIRQPGHVPCTPG